VTGDEYRDGIPSHSAADSLRRLASQSLCQLTVGDGFAVRNFQKCFPYPLLKGRTRRPEGRAAPGNIPQEIFRKPQLGIFQNSAGTGNRILWNMIVTIFLPVKYHSGQRSSIAAKKDSAQWGIKMINDHSHKYTLAS
jgi:hypothetical protein